MHAAASVVTTESWSGVQAVKALVEEAREAYAAAQRGRTTVYTADADCFWVDAGARPSRPLASVVLPDGVAQALLEDAAEFLEGESWYTSHGVPYRRGYLLYGPPGTGAALSVHP